MNYLKYFCAHEQNNLDIIFYRALQEFVEDLSHI